MYLAVCWACESGNHKSCHGTQSPPPGVFGGSSCTCECRLPKPEKVTDMKNSNWIVRMRCVVEKDVVVSNCTRAEAEKNPFEHAVDEMEVAQVECEVLSVKENN